MAPKSYDIFYKVFMIFRLCVQFAWIASEIWYLCVDMVLVNFAETVSKNAHCVGNQSKSVFCYSDIAPAVTAVLGKKLALSVRGFDNINPIMKQLSSLDDIFGAKNWSSKSSR